MKKKITLFSALFFSLWAFGQEHKTAHSEVYQYSRKIDSIIFSEKRKMNIELDKLDEDFKGKTASDEKHKRKTEIAEKYEKTINEKIENEKGVLEDATKEMVKDLVLNPDAKYRFTFEPHFGKIGFSGRRVKLPKDYLHSVKLSMAFLSAGLTSKDEPFRFNSKDSDVKSRVYNAANFALRYENQLGNFTSPLFYRIGIGMRSDNFAPKYGKVFAQDNHSLFIQDFTKGSLKSRSLYSTYIMLPVELRWVLNRKYTEYEGVKYVDNRQTQFYILGGLYGGVRVGSTIYNKYSTEYSKRIVERETVTKGLNDFIFGGKFGIGYGAVALYIQKDFTPTFNNDAMLTKKYGLQIGLELVSLTF